MQNGGTPRMLEEIEVSRAMFEAFEGAVVSRRGSVYRVLPLSAPQFMHQGLTYIVSSKKNEGAIEYKYLYN